MSGCTRCRIKSSRHSTQNRNSLPAPSFRFGRYLSITLANPCPRPASYTRKRSYPIEIAGFLLEKHYWAQCRICVLSGQRVPPQGCLTGWAMPSDSTGRSAIQRLDWLHSKQRLTPQKRRSHREWLASNPLLRGTASASPATEKTGRPNETKRFLPIGRHRDYRGNPWSQHVEPVRGYRIRADHPALRAIR